MNGNFSKTAEQSKKDNIDIYVSEKEFNRLLALARGKKPLSERIKLAVIRCDE